MRYFDFIKEIKEISTSHILVNEYGEGDIYEYLNNGEHKYPCIFLTVTNLTTTDSGTAINFTLFYTDRLVENQANKTAIQSTGISVIKQILSKYEQLHPEYLLNNVNYTPFTEKFTDMCAGIFCDVVIENQIDTLEDYDNECEEGAFAVKTITLTKNGVYDIVGYDSAVVLVEADCHEYEELVDELTNTIEQKEVEIDSLEKEIVNVNSINELLNEEINSLNMTIEQKDIIIYEKDEQINSVTTLSITENGTYTPPTDVLGYNEVVVNVESKVKRLKVSSLKVTNDCIVDGTWGAESIDTSNVEGMSRMFFNCSSLQSLDVLGWVTNNVTDMSYMFYNCQSLQSLDVSNFDTSNVKNMGSMFYNCQSLQSLGDLSNFDTSKVTNMGSMFSNCKSLQSLDVSNFVTNIVTDMSYMFYSCSSLQSLDVSNFDTSNVKNMGSMFGFCSSLQTLDLSIFVTNNVTDMSSMFSRSSLQSLDLSNFDTSKVTNMNWMFEYCSSLQSLDMSNFDTSKVTNMNNIFVGCRKLTTLIGGRTIDEVISNNISTFNGLKINISLDSTILDRASLRALINGLADLTGSTSQKLTLGSTLIAKLTEEDIAVATAKNWTIA